MVLDITLSKLQDDSDSILFIVIFCDRYCIVRPGQLGTGPATGVVNVIDGQGGSIQRADVASFLLDAVTDPKFPYIGKTPCLSSLGGIGWVKEKKEGFDAVTKA